jgi:hypothetical protein
LGPRGTCHSGAEPELDTVQEDQEGMDDGAELQMPDMATKHYSRHTDSAVGIGWSPRQPNVVISGGCDDHAYLWRVDQEGSCTQFALYPIGFQYIP